MRVACLGGGPAGLYFAISLKLRNPSHEINVFERNKPDDTFGWGVVLSDETLENLHNNDPVSAKALALTGSLLCRFSKVSSERTTPHPNVSSGLLRSKTLIS